MLDGVVIIAVVGVLLGGFTFLVQRTTDAGKRQRELRRAKLWSIADLPDVELGRIVGNVKATATLTSPLSGRACVYYSARIRLRGDDPLAGAFVETQGVPFELEDGSGVATIDPNRAESELAPTVYKDGLVQSLDAMQIAFIERHGYSNNTAGVWCEEHIVVPGATIAVLGFGVRRAGKLHMSSSPRFPLILADDGVSTRIELPAALARPQR